QRVALDLEFGDTALDDVTDTDDAHQTAVLQHRHVPEPAFGHRLGEFLDVSVQPTRLHVRRHDGRHVLGQDGGAVRREGPDDVTFGHDADDGVVGAGDDRGADVVLSQDREQPAYGQLRLDGDDVVAFASDEVNDSHWASLPRGARGKTES